MAEQTTGLERVLTFGRLERLYSLHHKARSHLIPVSVIITTYNEAQNLERCLNALKDFDDVLVVDSNSTDETVSIATRYGVRVQNFTWNGAYPKKRQWCLDNIETKYDYIFFVDGDEEITPDLVQEIKLLDFTAAGYFVKGQYIWRGCSLRHGLKNNKLALFDKNKIEFPVVNDLDIEGMGEIEGHYQPIFKNFRCTGALNSQSDRIDQLQSPLLHFAYEDGKSWQKRHERYAYWEAQMIKRHAYPKDPKPWRERLKYLFRKFPCRGLIAFGHCYILNLGFLDGHAGFHFAKSRYDYYSLVAKSLSRQ